MVRFTTILFKFKASYLIRRNQFDVFFVHSQIHLQEFMTFDELKAPRIVDMSPKNVTVGVPVHGAWKPEGGEIQGTISHPNSAQISRAECGTVLLAHATTKSRARPPFFGIAPGRLSNAEHPMLRGTNHEADHRGPGAGGGGRLREQ